LRISSIPIGNQRKQHKFVAESIKRRKENSYAQRFFSSRYTTRDLRELENVCEQPGKVLKDAGRRYR
jgi:hypothetical protein